MWFYWFCKVASTVAMISCLIVTVSLFLHDGTPSATNSAEHLFFLGISFDYIAYREKLNHA